MSDEVHVYFLDALDYRPLDPPLVLKDAKPWVRKAAPALLVRRVTIASDQHRAPTRPAPPCPAPPRPAPLPHRLR